jgi:tRNA pseudouridine38-40 synthase
VSACPRSKDEPRALKTIQEEVETALEKIVGHPVNLTGSGRTDAGVHAIAQPAHFSTTSTIKTDSLLRALNGYLPLEIAATQIQEVSSNFHARFSVRSKSYRYCVIPECSKSVFLSRFAYCCRASLSVPLMRREARCLVGRHDFSSFQASDRRPRKSITRIGRIKVLRAQAGDVFPFLKGVPVIVIDIEATGFLRGMVRNIVGTLVDIGRGRLKAGSMKEILRKRDRGCAGRCAPPQGLYLKDVRYA